MLEFREVDPRDTGWEVPRPTFRVSFWLRTGPSESHAWSEHSFDVTGADVDEVLAWATERLPEEEAPNGYVGGERTFTVAAVVPPTPADRPGLVWLHGDEPTSSAGPRRVSATPDPDDVYDRPHD